MKKSLRRPHEGEQKGLIRAETVRFTTPPGPGYTPGWTLAPYVIYELMDQPTDPRTFAVCGKLEANDRLFVSLQTIGDPPDKTCFVALDTDLVLEGSRPDHQQFLQDCARLGITGQELIAALVYQLFVDRLLVATT